MTVCNHYPDWLMLVCVLQPDWSKQLGDCKQDYDWSEQAGVAMVAWTGPQALTDWTDGTDSAHNSVTDCKDYMGD